jgi:gp16 family phage-associated protein
MHATRTPAQAKAWLEDQGKSIKDFADEKGLDPATTYQVLAGTKKGRRGEAHRVAVALGIKEGVCTVVPAAQGEN